jgi:hypothetical protein
MYQGYRSVKWGSTHHPKAQPAHQTACTIQASRLVTHSQIVENHCQTIARKATVSAKLPNSQKTISAYSALPLNLIPPNATLPSHPILKRIRLVHSTRASYFRPCIRLTHLPIGIDRRLLRHWDTEWALKARGFMFGSAGVTPGGQAPNQRPARAVMQECQSSESRQRVFLEAREVIWDMQSASMSASCSLRRGRGDGSARENGHWCQRGQRQGHTISPLARCVCCVLLWGAACTAPSQLGHR